MIGRLLGVTRLEFLCDFSSMTMALVLGWTTLSWHVFPALACMLHRQSATPAPLNLTI